MTNSNSSLQAGWQVVKLGQIAKEIRTTTKTPIEDGLEFYVGLEHLDSQSLRIQRKGVIAEDNPTFNKRFLPGHILFGRRRAYLKKAAVANFEGICSGDITVIEALPGLIIPKLLPFIVQSDIFFDWAVKNSAGGLSPRVKWKSLADFEFPLPSVERQGEIFEVLEKVEENLLFYQSTLNDVLSLQNSLRDRLINKVSITFTNAIIEKKQLGDVVKKIIGGGTPRRSEEQYWDGDVPWVTVKDLKGVRLSCSLESITKKGVDSSATNVIPANTVILATRIGVGKVAIFDKPVAINQDLKALLCSDVLETEYLLHWLLLHESYFDSIGTGTTVKGINLNLIKNTPFELPSQKVQLIIVEILNNVEQIEITINKKLQSLSNIRKQYFFATFKGKPNE